MIMDTITNLPNYFRLYCPYCLEEGKLSLLFVEIAHCKSENYVIRIKDNERGFAFSRAKKQGKSGKFMQYFISCEQGCDFETSFWSKSDLETELNSIKELLEFDGKMKLQEALGREEEDILSLFQQSEPDIKQSKKPKLLGKPKELVLELVRSPLANETET